MSLKDSALAVLQRNHERNQPATSEEKTAQLNTHLEGGKVAHDKLMICIKTACKGLSITPQQFTALLTEEDKHLIIKGKFEGHTLRAYARSFAEGIQSRLIVFHPKTVGLLRHG